MSFCRSGVGSFIAATSPIIPGCLVSSWLTRENMLASPVSPDMSRRRPNVAGGIHLPRISHRGLSVTWRKPSSTFSCTNRLIRWLPYLDACDDIMRKFTRVSDDRTQHFLTEHITLLSSQSTHSEIAIVRMGKGALSCHMLAFCPPLHTRISVHGPHPRSAGHLASGHMRSSGEPDPTTVAQRVISRTAAAMAGPPLVNANGNFRHARL